MVGDGISTSFCLSAENCRPDQHASLGGLTPYPSAPHHVLESCTQKGQILLSVTLMGTLRLEARGDMGIFLGCGRLEERPWSNCQVWPQVGMGGKSGSGVGMPKQPLSVLEGIPHWLRLLVGGGHSWEDGGKRVFEAIGSLQEPAWGPAPGAVFLGFLGLQK